MAGKVGSGCGGPIGNKNAVGNNGGRPCKFDKELEFQELKKWAMRDDALVFRYFPASRGYSPDSLEDWAKANDEFLQIYNSAKILVGVRRELRLIEANNSKPFDRYATFYDEQLHRHEKCDLEHKAKVAQEAGLTQDQPKTFNVNFGNNLKISSETVSAECVDSSS